MTLYARIKSGTVPDYLKLTHGKEYPVKQVYPEDDCRSGRFFRIICDDNTLTGFYENSADLNGDWEPIERPEAKE